MLGIGNKNNTWSWTAHGKHPVARDYFAIGREQPISKAFSEWINGGVHSFNQDKEMLTKPVSWRFWARLPQRDGLACGVIRNSCDAIGRPFPLLIMGCGILDKFESKWSLLPLACEGSWQQLEHLAARRFADFDHFQGELPIIKAPAGDWPTMEKTMRADFAMPSELPKTIAEIDQRGAGFIPLWGKGENDPMLLAGQWHLALQHHLKNPPNAVFIGGLDRLAMAVFNRPMQTADFANLWQLNPI